LVGVEVAPIERSAAHDGLADEGGRRRTAGLNGESIDQLLVDQEGAAVRSGIDEARFGRALLELVGT